MKDIAIIGYGGFAREVKAHLSPRKVQFFVDDVYWRENTSGVLKLSQFDVASFRAIVAVGDPTAREDIVNRMPVGTEFFTFVHPSATILDEETIEIGEGSIICAGTVLTTNIQIGKHAHLNLNSTVGHDCVIGDYFTASPGVNLSGNLNVGNRVYVGTNSAIREKIYICDDVTIGMQSGVVKNITEKGTYVGSPTKRL